MGPLYGFTSDLPPAYFIPVDSPSNLANGEFPRPSATGGFLADFLGNTRFTGPTTVGTLDETWSFAVLDQLSSASGPGDVFGTGSPTFDAVTGIDTSARFLYLYHETNDGVLSDPIDVSPGWIAEGATSDFAVDLVLTDEDGETTLTNQFGTDDGKAHSFDGTTTFGVVDPGLASSFTLIPASVEIDAPTEDLTVSYDPPLVPNEIGWLFGFSSNRRPIYISYVGANDDTPVPLPEPSTELMLLAAIAALMLEARRRALGAGPRASRQVAAECDPDSGSPGGST